MLENDLLGYQPFNEQEERDKALILRCLRVFPDVFCRENLIAHMTASSWIVDESGNNVLMAFHHIYQAWAWTGGHADGEKDLLQVALREAKEETGVSAAPVTKDIYSIEVLTVDGHIKRGIYVPSHLHLNVTFLLKADISSPIRRKEDENAAVKWFPIDRVCEECGEKWMGERIYSKLNRKLALLGL